MRYGFGFGVDRLTPAFRVFAPIGDEAPPKRIERYLTGLMIAADYQQILTRGTIPSRRIVVNAAIPHIHSGDNAVAKRPAALDHPPAHDCYVVIGPVSARDVASPSVSVLRENQPPPLRLLDETRHHTS